MGIERWCYLIQDITKKEQFRLNGGKHLKLEGLEKIYDGRCSSR